MGGARVRQARGKRVGASWEGGGGKVTRETKEKGGRASHRKPAQTKAAWARRLARREYATRIGRPDA